MKQKLTYYDNNVERYFLTEYGRNKMKTRDEGVVDIIGTLEAQIDYWVSCYDSVRRFAERTRDLDEKDEI